jgi:alpha-D-xyloside xylohydrolase
MDFSNDPNVANIGDEYMFGPSLLVVPVTEQGRTSREVYLPAGVDWYNFWTNEKMHGGQRIMVDAPIDIIPLFVRAGSILPLGEPVESTNEPQRIASLRVYPGADTDFALYDDDGTTYTYEKGQFELTHLHWDDGARKLSRSGAELTPVSNENLIYVVGDKP